jgi:hypothetical protein
LTAGFPRHTLLAWISREQCGVAADFRVRLTSLDAWRGLIIVASASFAWLFMPLPSMGGPGSPSCS